MIVRSNMLELVKKLKDGRYLFCRDGVNFSLTLKQVKQLSKLINKLEKENKDD